MSGYILLVQRLNHDVAIGGNIVIYFYNFSYS